MIHNADLRSLNTLRLPGVADAFASFASVSELLTLLDDAERLGLGIKVLGGGSNVLLAGDIHALVIQSAMTRVQVLSQTDAVVRVAVDAGKVWHDWVVESIACGHGLENLALIPGSVGAAPVQNIGAYGVEVAQCLESVVGLQLSTRQLRVLSAGECGFGYRDSVFKRELSRDFVILRVVFRLQRVFQPELSYGPLRQWADNMKAESSDVTPAALIREVCAIRSSKLPSPAEIPNAGSFFKNPVVPTHMGQALKARYPALPVYPQADGSFKLAAGWLIEQAGWKGKWLGNAGMHTEQALVLVTNGQASYGDVTALKDAVIRDVAERFAVVLEPEPQPF
ncbi:UDP-N-acetylmuramate dehydrogenase [Thalassolituus sp. LLYu03]|uniref:UDP-N-acetylmuramate dehydrogenase n=1 Tax=Thalassolituus sp. LLYu03 TaxID=3421656 RepID=UPI003D2D41DD